ncbi:predicted protein [Naegleria gruberi]|uniref:Predicted protein n=1 Tax=Naegleria gruberi TaxID=5762 RepID=D2VNW6_NAEGR|nr:uncharacterized protein NAEGRDRAFT_58788 [Naegleria gruberi]EFC41563.1 predicted protein [Naegleria gruberi]|eukprot:XP_002674307.1 predicted protein [Naegleria gruberi strain NEG-M]
MFKKTLKQTQSHNLKSSDRRKLLKQLQEQYRNIPAPSNADDEEGGSASSDEINPWRLLVPTKNQNVELSKFVIYHQTAASEAILEEIQVGKNVPNKKKKQQQLQKQQLRAASDVQTFNVITVDNVPMFFSIEKEEIYYPTIFALQIAPNLVDTIYIAQPVSHYLLQGADLMKPGVSKNQKNQNMNLIGGERLNNKGSHGGIGPFKKGDIRSIQVRGNPIPFAIGDMIMDFDEFSKADKGKCFETVHIFNDFMWQFGVNHAPSTYSQPVGFTSQIIEILSVEEDEDGEQPTTEKVEVTPLATEGKSTVEGSDDEAEPSGEGSSDIKPEEMDSLLESYFLTALKSSVEDDQLPMEGSGFYTKMFEFSEDIVLDIKKSTYKKWSKFLKQMQKENLVKMKDVKGTFFVTNINRSHPKYLAARELSRSST